MELKQTLFKIFGIGRYSNLKNIQMYGEKIPGTVLRE